MRTRLVLGEPGGVCRSRLSSNDGGGGLGGELGRVGGVCRSRLSSKDGDEGFGGELGGVPAIAQEKSSESDLNQNGYWVQLGLGRPCGTLLAKPGTQSISFPLASQDLSRPRSPIHS